MKQCIKYEFFGIVQGVGFRPFIYQLAEEFNLKGFVYNCSYGVISEVEGETVNLEYFEKSLHEKLPPLAKIESFQKIQTNLKNYKTFKIRKSQVAQNKIASVSPDMALCEKCKTEFNDKNNRRFKYPLINCTNCGPRYSIIYTVPYDRPNTSMKNFEMCEECKREYENPQDRRYHAQPISCKNCGPTISFTSLKSNFTTTINPLKKLSKDIKDGKIVALKGMGGFHIICDATNEESIKKLRVKKRRPHKPFAIMVSDIEMAKKYCLLSKHEECAISSIFKPIVLLNKKDDCTLNENIAPMLKKLGLFLPYTALHEEIFSYIKVPLIASSANLSGEPIITNKEELVYKLGDVIDSFVDFDREIVNFSDDSVLHLVGDKKVFLRNSRGLAPFSLQTNFSSKEKILALGANQKSTIAIFHDGQITISPYIGDLNSVDSYNAFKKTIKTFEQFYDFKASYIVCDLHPNYGSTLFAKEQNLPTIQLQHHYAHTLCVMFENNLKDNVLGVLFDGTGYGSDKTIWGGEFLICNVKDYKRVCTFKPFKLLSGDKSIKNISKIAYSIFYEHKDNSKVKKLFKHFTKDEHVLLSYSYEKNINAIFCSSVGRLFDAVAFVALNLHEVTYEGQSGMYLESLYDDTIKEFYKIVINEKNEIEYEHWFLQMLDESPQQIATKFINSLALVILSVAKKYNLQVVLSGGVFQNSVLLKSVISLFEKENINYFLPKNMSPNDSSIALGQLIFALNKLNMTNIINIKN